MVIIIESTETVQGRKFGMPDSMIQDSGHQQIVYPMGRLEEPQSQMAGPGQEFTVNFF